MKIYIYITDVERAINGDFEWSLSASTRDDIGNAETGWFLAGEVEVDINVDHGELTKFAIKAIDEEEAKIKEEATAKLALLSRKRSELLALTHQGES